MPTRPVGRTGLTLTELGLGGGALGNLYREIPDDDARATLDVALAAGIRYFDTAPYYGFGLSERRIGDGVRGCADAVVSTKVGRLLAPAAGPVDGERHGFRSPMPFAPRYDYSHDGVLRSFEDSLQRLGLGRIDLLLVHDIGAATHGADHPRRLAELVDGGGLRALERLRGEGSVAAIGLGVNEVAICLEVMEHVALDAVLLAGRYTLLEQGALDTLFPACRAAGTSIVIGGPYNSGLLAGSLRSGPLHYDYAPAPAATIDRARAIDGVCARYDVALGAAALQFVLAHPLVASVVPGVSNAAELRETIARYEATIPAGLWSELKHSGLLHADAPVPHDPVVAR